MAIASAKAGATARIERPHTQAHTPLNSTLNLATCH